MVVDFVEQLYQDNFVKFDDLQKQVAQAINDSTKIVTFFCERPSDTKPNDMFKLFAEFARDV